MGDRTTVTLTILVSQQEEAIKHFSCEADDASTEGLFSHHQFGQINYGNLDFLVRLQDAGIAYDSSWEGGFEYGPGTESLRFDSNGNAIEITVYDSDKNPDLGHLMERIDKPEELRDCILNHYKQVTSLPWENQEEYGKISRVKQLINPT